MTGQAGKVARGLRTIGANVTQLAQNAKEFDITVNGATKTIQLWNAEGTDMLNTYDVLKQISEVWDDMTNAEKASLAVDLAKKTQMDTFLAVMGNFNDAEKAYTTSLLAEGSALEENAKYMESIEAHQKKLQQAWSELVLSAPFEELEKALLDAGTAILKFANSDVGRTIIQITALIAVMSLANSALKGFMLLAQEPSAGVLLRTIASLITGETTLTVVTETLTTALLSNPLFWGAAAITGTVLIVKAVEALTVTFEEQIEVLQTYNKAVKDSESECQNLIEKLGELQKQIEEIEDKKVGITDSDDVDALNEEKAVLQEQEALLKSQIALKEAQLKLDREKAKTQAEKIQNTGVEYVATVDNPDAWNAGEKERRFGEVGEALKASIPIVEEYRQKVQELEKQMNSYQTEEELASDEAKATAEELQSTREEYIEMQEVMNDYASDIIDVKMAGIELTKANQEGYEAWEQYQDQLRSTDEDSQNLLGQIESMTDSMEDASDVTKDTNGIFSDFFDNVEGLQSAYETLTKAADEYNKNGFITASTLKKLNKLEPEYLASLYKEGDMYTNISNTLNTYLDKEKSDAKIKVEIARVTALLEIAQNKLNGETDKSKTAIDNFATAASGASDDVAQLKNLTAQLAINMGAIRNQGKVDEDLVSQLQDANAFFDGLSESIDKVNLGAVESSKSAAGSHKDAWVEAFEEEQRQLKHSLEMNEITELEYYDRLKDLNEKYFGEISGKHQKYIKEYQENEEEIYKGTKAVYDKVKDYLKEAVEQGYEKAINALKKEEKAVLAEIKSQIENLKKEKKSVLDGIKDQINALKKQKEQVQKYYNDQIDAIKKENEVLQEQNQLLEYQQQLQQAKAQKVMVMQDGKFQLGENESAVAQAEQNLNNYKDQLSYEQQIQQLEELRDAQVEAIEARIQSLEEYYDYMEDYYDRQIEAMEDYYDRVQEQYEKQIEALQEELDTFKEGYQKSEDLDNARLAAEVMAANEEASVWRTRLDNLAEAISEYNRLLSLMGEEGVYATSGFSGGTISHNAIAEISGVNAQLEGFKSRASGDASFASNEVALVGESPNAELVLGSKLNHSLGGGSLVNLSKGSGVVNAESTRTLAGLLNGLANPQNVSTSHTTQQTFTFGSISLPNVTNAETFVGALRDKFNNYSIQSTTIKK